MKEIDPLAEINLEWDLDIEREKQLIIEGRRRGRDPEYNPETSGSLGAIQSAVRTRIDEGKTTTI